MSNTISSPPINITAKNNGFDVTAVNPGYWFGNIYIISVSFGNFSKSYAVEADNESDAIDEFTDSEYGGLIIIDEKDCDENTNYAGNYGKPVDLTNFYIEPANNNFRYFGKYCGRELPESGLTGREFYEFSSDWEVR